MNRKLFANKLIDAKVIAVIRAKDYRDAWDLLDAYFKAGIKAVEITTTCPEWETLLKRASNIVPDEIIVGVGTVTSSDDVKKSVDNGARFIVSPFVSNEVIGTAIEHDIAVIPGALTPSEIAHAFSLGADMVKVFPVENVGGPKYLRAILAPMPEWKLVPTGGVNRENAFDYFKAGAAAIGIGSNLAPNEALLNRDWSAVSSTVSEFLKSLNSRLEYEL
ncbi:MAG TPA: bifunctional 4-hydroxy-2-oxoglutarate aldolase/2-dehydro-3-deoxy-phosphogluconate aldolase [Firmicutes bacterium]|nr:bifunctional 4-hydroxy-2-oxoglutarate aldolase/2-dehydro-3-deoxy-phosphogluconate aldolase [Bacillota bacterium]